MSNITRRQFRNQLSSGVSLGDASLQRELGKLGIHANDLKRIDGPKGDGQIRGTKELNALFHLVDRRLDSNGRSRSISSQGKAGKAYKALSQAARRNQEIKPEGFASAYDSWCSKQASGTDQPQKVSEFMASTYGLTDAQKQHVKKALEHLNIPGNNRKARVFAYARIAELGRKGQLNWVDGNLDGSVKSLALTQQILSPRNAGSVQKLVQDPKFGSWLKSDNHRKALVQLAGKRGETAVKLLQDPDFRQARLGEARRLVGAYLLSPALAKAKAQGNASASVATLRKDLDDIQKWAGNIDTSRIPDMMNYSGKIADRMITRPWLWHAMDKNTRAKVTKGLLQSMGLSVTFQERSMLNKDSVAKIRAALSSFKQDTPKAYKALIGGTLANMGLIDKKSLFGNLASTGLSEALSEALAKKIGDPASKLAGPVVGGLVAGGMELAQGKGAAKALRSAYMSALVGGIVGMAAGSASLGPIGALGTLPLELATEWLKNKRIQKGLRHLIVQDPKLRP